MTSATLRTVSNAVDSYASPVPNGVIVDADVLYSRTLRDWLFLLRNETAGGMFRLYATVDIVAETIARYRDNNPLASGSTITAMHDAIFRNLDDRIDDYEIDGSFPGHDQGDAHVHAAALACRADFLVANDRGFKDLDDSVLDALPYEVHTADSFLVLVDDSMPQAVRAVTKQQLEYWLSKKQDADLPLYLRKAGCPDFAARVRNHVHALAD